MRVLKYFFGIKFSASRWSIFFMNSQEIKKYLHAPAKTREDYQEAYENYELEYWCSKFGVSQEKLKQAIAKVGVSVTDVEGYLRRNGLVA